MKHNESTNPVGEGRDPFDLIKSQDPASGMAPDLSALRRLVDARIAADDDEGALDMAPATVIDLGSVRGRRSAAGRRWMMAAAAAVGVVVVGAGGYLIGTGGSSVDDIAGPGVSVVTTTGAELGTVELSTVQPPVGPGVGGQEVGGPNPSGLNTADTKMSGSTSRTVFTAADSLGKEGSSAAGWTFDPASVFSEKKAADLAEKLGVTGDPRLEYGTWTVGATDGTGAVLQLMPDGAASVSFSDVDKDPSGCAVAIEPVDPAAGASPDSGDCATDLADAPQGDAAVAEAKQVIGDLGVDTATLSFQLGESGDAKSSFVTAEVLINELPTGLSWSVNLSGAGVFGLYGPLAPVVSLGDYNVISPAEAVARLSDPRFDSAGGPVMPLDGGMAVDGAVVGGDVAVDGGPAASDPTPPAVAKPGQPISWPVAQVTITGAQLITTQQYQTDGSILLLPAYSLTDDSGSAWTVVAVADDAFDFAG